MALGALSLSVTQGVQGHSFKSKINGLTGRYAEVVGPRDHDFAVINGYLVSRSVDLEFAAVTIREYDALGFRDTTVVITSGTPAAVEAIVRGLASTAGYQIANIAQPDGSIIPTIVTRSAAGAAVLTSPTGGSTPTPTPTPTPAPSLSLSSAITQAEGNSGTTTFAYTLTLNRDGSTAAYPYTWAVTGSGANPADAADFGGTFPTGSGTFAAGETVKTITVLVAGDTAVEPDDTFTLTVTSTGLNTVTATGTITNDDVTPTGPYLDTTGLVATWGNRRVVANYNGPAKRVARNSDAAEMDIGFASGSDMLDTAALDAFTGTRGDFTDVIFYDQIGTNHAPTGATVANRPRGSASSLNDISGNRTSVMGSTNAITSAGGLTIPSTVSVNSRSFTTAVALRPQSNFTKGALIELGTVSPVLADMYFTGSNGQPTNAGFGLLGLIGGGSERNYGVGVIGRAQPMVYAMSSGASGANIYADEKSVASAVATSNTLTGGKVGLSVFGSQMRADFLSAAVWNTPLSASAIASARAALMPAQARPTRQIIYDGDSIQYGVLATFGANLQRQVEPLLNAPADQVNIGIFGQYASNIDTTFAGRAGAITALDATGATYAKRDYFLWVGHNDIANNAKTDADVLATIQSIATKAKAAGYRVIIGTVLPGTDITATKETYRVSLNASIRALGPTYMDACADFASDPTMGAATVSTALRPDGIHPSSAGYATLAPIAAAALNGLP